MIQRSRPPAKGSWSLPGGRCLPGEFPAHACVRELAEETGLRVEVLRHVGRVERNAPDGGVYVIDDFLCRLHGGRLRAGDDAADARWVDREQLRGLSLAPGLWDALSEWSMLPD